MPKKQTVKCDILFLIKLPEKIVPWMQSFVVGNRLSGKLFSRKKCQILPDEIFPDKVSAQLLNGMNYFMGYVNVWRYEFLYTTFSL